MRKAIMNYIKGFVHRHIAAPFPHEEECWGCHKQSCKGCAIIERRK